ncbi:Phospholipase A2 [Desmophyllum pertusum]|uniref:Phospholipase A2 n=1 Tax=Desmophyllum pertusum TaxID=174260 RepID=A0A9X0DBI9_9CNID|nr:Phospholipase A2 [Desmophyllum pertusum]
MTQLYWTEEFDGYIRFNHNIARWCGAVVIHARNDVESNLPVCRSVELCFESNPMYEKHSLWPRTVDNHCCQFPFHYKGRKYRSCTYHGDINNHFWCATEFKFNKNKTTGWGYCKLTDSQCFVKLQTKIAAFFRLLILEKSTKTAQLQTKIQTVPTGAQHGLSLIEM